MHIKINKELLDGDYYVTLQQEETTEIEDAEFNLATKKYGKVIVDVGGTYIDPLNSDELFKFNQNLKHIPFDLPYSRVFKFSQYSTKAKEYAEIYANSIEKKINTSFDALRSKVDDFSDADIDIHY